MLTLLGLWDIRQTPVTLGGLLLYLAEMSMMSQLYGSKSRILCFLDSKKRHKGVERFIPDQCKEFPLFSLLAHIKGIDGFVRADSMASIYEYKNLLQRQSTLWPKPLPISVMEYDVYKFNSTLPLQMNFLEQGHIPNVELSEYMMKWAESFLQHHASYKIPFVLHLKNNATGRQENNANLEEWLQFLIYAQCYKNILFILIGNEMVDIRMHNLSNVLITQNLGLSLVQELALIHRAGAFIGMSSGPASMAIFSTTPYFIFHSPHGGQGALVQQLGNSDMFSFSVSGQRFLRKNDDRDSIQEAFEWLLPYAKSQYSLRT